MCCIASVTVTASFGARNGTGPRRARPEAGAAEEAVQFGVPALLRSRSGCKMGCIVKRVATVVLLLVVVGLAACGDDEPAQPVVEVPPWAKVAPEQVAEAMKHGVPVAFENDLGMRFVLWRWGFGDESALRSCYLLASDVTNGQYRAFDPQHKLGESAGDPRNADERPVKNITPRQAVEFATWLTRRDSRRTYRVPDLVEVMDWPQTYMRDLPADPLLRQRVREGRVIRFGPRPHDTHLIDGPQDMPVPLNGNDLGFRLVSPLPENRE